MIKRFSLLCAALACSALTLDGNAASADRRDSRLSPDERARLLEQELTQDERIGMLHSPLAMDLGDYKKPAGVMASAGYIAGVPRLGIPALHESDASLGVTNPLNSRPGDSATAMPSGLALASTWNPSLAREAGALIGREAHAKGFNVLLAGGVNLARDPRGGRNFEYLGEDPLLAGTLAGASISGIQSQHVVSTMKHFALNGYENGRNHHNIVIGEAAMQESDLLAFKLALERGQPGAVMCAYNKVNGSYACENEALLGKVLKQDWGFRGWVMSDWGAVHSVAAAKVLDHQSGEQLDKQVYFGEPLKQAVAAGTISQARLSDMARRMLRSMLTQGLFDHPATQAPIDYVAHARLAQQAAAEGMVLLRNRDRLLPLRSGLKRIAVIGGNASLGVLSGGGSSQVTPYGASPLIQPLGGVGPLDAMFRRAFWFAPAPLDAIRERAGPAEIVFNDGRYPDAAAALARDADVVIVFATQWNGEGEDLSDLSLPQGQDALITAVTTANPRTVVVLETGNPVLMPWIEQSGAILEAWYPGQYGAAALADILFGKVNPSGRLPMTFPQSPQQLPRPQLPGQGMPPDSGFDIVLNEGADVGYRWFARKQLTPLFPFGYGLSYTSFDVSNLQIEGGNTLTVHFDVTNTGDREGADVPQVYLRSAAGKQQMRLIGWEKVQLAPGQRRRVKVVVDPRLLADYDTTINGWRIAAGDYALAVGRDAGHAALFGSARLVAQTIKP